MNDTASPDSAAPSGRLRRRISERGPIVFAEVMEEALYGEGGYYNRDRLPIGEEGGDYVTGSALSTLFGGATARLLGRLDTALGGRATLLEAGYGDGRHLHAVAAAAPGARLIGWDRIRRPLPDGVECLEALDELMEPIDGLVFSYELFDALPVHRLVGRADGSLGELWVDVDADGTFVWRPGDLSDPGLDALVGGETLRPGQVADLSPGWRPLQARLASKLGRGLLVACDYGYERRQLLDPRIRFHGTLACYAEHRVNRDALSRVGEQDLTAHVDFTTLREAGEAAGLTTVALTRQARWLTGLDLFEELGDSSDFETRRQAAVLLDPAGMGDQIRVLVQARGVDPATLFDASLFGGAGASD